MSKPLGVNYRKICKKHYGYTDKQMRGMDVHHKDGNRKNNTPENLQLLSVEEHVAIHNLEFVRWARIGSRLGNEAFRKRLLKDGPTEKELQNRENLLKRCKAGMHRTPHTDQTKIVISEKKKEWYSNNPEKHPMWGNTTYIFTSPDGEKFVVSGGVKQWCKDRGLVLSNLIKVASGQRKHCKGWTAKRQ